VGGYGSYLNVTFIINQETILYIEHIAHSNDDNQSSLNNRAIFF